MAKAILDRFFNAYLSIRTPEKYLDYYSKKFILKDVKVKYVLDGKKYSGRVVGINPETYSLTVSARKSQTIDIRKASEVIIPKKIKLPSQK